MPFPTTVSTRKKASVVGFLLTIGLHLLETWNGGRRSKAGNFEVQCDKAIAGSVLLSVLQFDKDFDIEIRLAVHTRLCI